MELAFWTSLAFICYTFVGYGCLIWVLVSVKRILFKKKRNVRINYRPTCTVLIAAFNEESYIEEKIKNTLSLDYPAHLLEILVVADGSTDNTVDIIKEFPNVKLLYNKDRKGKVHAVNRAMLSVKSDIVVFTDANTYLNTNALIAICSHYQDSTIGGVAGEKRIFSEKKADASTAGESLYWRYESILKRLDSELNTAIGAAGELFSIRTHLFEKVPDSVVLDDFFISMKITMRGFRIVYEPEAYAIETSSANIHEELKRKVRIAAGGIQSIVLLTDLLDVTRKPLLSFQYISHRVFRWTIVPFLIILAFIANALLILGTDNLLYEITWYGQISFYILAFLGYLLEKKRIKIRAAFIPYYFCVMNYSVIAGIFKYLQNEQSAIWEKSNRKQASEILR